LKEIEEAASLKIPLTVQGSSDANELPEIPKHECGDADVEDGLALVQRAKTDDEIPKEQVHNFSLVFIHFHIFSYRHYSK
jgi:hypothetical protein